MGSASKWVALAVSAHAFDPVWEGWPSVGLGLGLAAAGDTLFLLLREGPARAGPIHGGPVQAGPTQAGPAHADPAPEGPERARPGPTINADCPSPIPHDRRDCFPGWDAALHRIDGRLQLEALGR